MAEEQNRWENVYHNKEGAETSWFADRPQVSLDLIAATGSTRDAAIADVGAGASRLVDCQRCALSCRARAPLAE